MNKPSLVTLLTGILVMGSVFSTPLYADRDTRDRRLVTKQEKQEEKITPDKQKRSAPPRVVPRDNRDSRDRRDNRDSRDRRDNRDSRDRRRPPRDYVIDRRYHHDRYYPPTGHRITRLPRGYRVLHHHDRSYYYHGGIWYLHSGLYFVVTMPPIGISIPILPPYYTTIWVGGLPYYYANGVYYLWHPAQRVYVVTDPPPADAISEEPTEPKKLFIYPKQGQTAEQQAKDRYECHAWAVQQAGFDPTRANGGVPVDQYVNKREDYHRAMKACLEARGYSVK